ncbi:DtxR family Mn-dependent transcriptional regulator [Marisediminicola sp. UYEF4]|uniref:metal-dependent transcriptional regulator n=1 Tax=Marisediminicola sp. UYEF4 TaxID=1756384 RepID=UPI003397F46E
MSPQTVDGVAVEDYVKAIYSHTEWQPDAITPSELASRLGLAASSVTEMVKKLGRSGLVVHVPYGAVTLTAAGTVLALRMVRRHRLIETWLVEHFGYDWDEVHDEAEVLEHALSDRLLGAIADRLGQPIRDPHGDPIPAADGSIVRPAALRLLDASDGSAGAVVRISDRDPALLRYLTAEGITLDAHITVVGRRPFGGSLAVRLDGADGAARELDLGAEAAASIWISTD